MAEEERRAHVWFLESMDRVNRAMQGSNDLEQVMSDYRPSSEISRLCRSAIYGPVKVSADLYRVLQRSLDLARWSEGAFDPTVGPLVALWRQARQTKVLPTQEAIQAAKERVGWQYVDLDDRNRTVFLRKHNLKVDFGGIAKGDACNEALKVLRSQGIKIAMVEAGGDLQVSDPPPGKPGWTIEIQGRKEPVVIKNMALSTSGDSEQFVEIDGKRYSHIVDPKTGLGLTNRLQASILARDGLTTDPLATMVCVMGLERSRGILAKYRSRAIVLAPMK